ncbi:tyrosine-type recombinase/integrase [Flexibacterium corallicola]|uniref:tyrosine-type recombinase/integrase n=1 Tax=Flexibacterium corallicola TaxID=3037259 RepID=UPI00286F2A54|nr:tyrosine-type recombinase/integrase [Pseudovibrio sp. M1P-2-3]
MKRFNLNAYIGTFPTQRVDKDFVIPSFQLVRSGCLLDSPRDFLVALQAGYLARFYLSHQATKDFYCLPHKGQVPRIGLIGKRRHLSARTLSTYRDHLLKFLVWCEVRGKECGDYQKYDPINLASTRDPLGKRGSLEDFEDDMLNRQEFTSKNREILKAIGMVVNSYILFLVAYDVRTRPFIPYEFSIPKTWTAVSAAPPKQPDMPLLSELKAWVRGTHDLRFRVVRSIICFGGLRHQEVLSLTRSHILPPTQVEMDPSNLRVKLHLLGKGNKWRTTTLPRFVYDDIRAWMTTGRQELERKLWERQKIKLGRAQPEEPIFISIRRDRFKKAMTAGFVDRAFLNVPFKHWSPHTGRHAFAVNRLTELVLQQMKGLSRTRLSPKEAFERAILTQGPLEVLRLEMGHSSAETTGQYIRYMRARAFGDQAIIGLKEDIEEFYS